MFYNTFFIIDLILCGASTAQATIDITAYWNKSSNLNLLFTLQS